MQDSSSTIKQQLVWATEVLHRVSSSAALDSEVLLAYCLQKERTYLLSWPERKLTDGQYREFHELVRRRLQPQPVAYLTGHREFYSMELTITPDTLVPRPETEMLVDLVVDRLAGLRSAKILELGTGTGAISLAIKKTFPDCQIMATDISKPALQVAQTNALGHQLDINFIESDWYQQITPQKFDIIVSNPPYIAESDPYLDQGDLPAEPLQALSSGESGLEAIEIIIQDARRYLQQDGWVLLEHGYDQQQPVTDIFVQQGFRDVATINDFNDLPRVTLAKL